eukprot:scaffold132225_cov43-Attheya_sp.AAC.3
MRSQTRDAHLFLSVNCFCALLLLSLTLSEDLKQARLSDNLLVASLCYHLAYPTIRDMRLGCEFPSGAAGGGFLSGSARRCLFTHVTSKIDLCRVRLSPCQGLLYQVRSGRAALSAALPFFSIEECLRCLAHECGYIPRCCWFLAVALLSS